MRVLNLDALNTEIMVVLPYALCSLLVRYRKQITAVEIRRADHWTPLCSQKLALTSPTSCGRSVGIVHSRTLASEFVLLCILSVGCVSLYIRPPSSVSLFPCVSFALPWLYCSLNLSHKGRACGRRLRTVFDSDLFIT
jgi:hypothetical protein